MGQKPPETSLKLGADYLDEATENLTFDEFAWAFEEVGRAIFWVLNALTDGSPDVDLPPKGEFLKPATLQDVAARISRPPKLKVLRRFDAVTARIRRAGWRPADQAPIRQAGQRPDQAPIRQAGQRSADQSPIRRAGPRPADQAPIRQPAHRPADQSRTRRAAGWPADRQLQDLDVAFAVNAGRIEELVFEAWELHDEVSKRLGQVDERLGDKLILADVSPGKVGSQVIHRRTALKLIAAGSVLPLAACEKVESDNRPASATPPAKATTEATPQSKVRQVSPLGGMQWQTSDPFLFCAHHLDDYPVGAPNLGPAASLEGRHLGRDFEGRDNWRMYHGREVPGFPRHPHRGFETVTVVRTGMLDHSDSMGATARYGGGDVQWLTAGGGIQHAEMFPLLQADTPNPLELFQIWLNLPAKSKMVPPHFTMLWSEKIPRVAVKDSAGRLTELTISAGGYRGERPPAPPPNSWASDPSSDLAIWSIRMEPQATFELPAANAGTERSLYFHRGAQVTVAGQVVPSEQRIELDGHGAVQLQAGPDEIELLLLQGRPIGEPVAKRGPFVMNTQEEIRQAYADYQATQFGGWPWRRNDPVHEGSKGRFAKNIDGSFEQPT